MCAMSINSENNPNVETSAISLHVFETTSSEIKILTNLVLEIAQEFTQTPDVLKIPAKIFLQK